MILELVEHGPLIWPTIKENKVTRTKKYVKLSATEKLQADCDMKEINIILQGLPTEIYSLFNHHRVAKDLCEKLYAYLEQNELHANEVRLMRKRNQDPLALVANHQMTPPHFNIYQSSHNNPQFQQQFSPSQSHQYGSTHPTQHYSTTYPSTPHAITYPSAPYMLTYVQNGSGPMGRTRQKGVPHPISWYCRRSSYTAVITHNAVYQADDLDAYDSDCDEISIAKAVLIANLSSYKSNVLSEVPISDNTHNDMLNQSVQEMSYFEPSHFVEHSENEIHSDSNIILYSRYLIESQTAAVQDTNSSA
ncbi:hypothetical protein Tco_0219174 [Tanacetum coccineum]